MYIIRITRAFGCWNQIDNNKHQNPGNNNNDNSNSQYKSLKQQ